MVLRERDLVRNTRHGFTLMEILVVVAIIVILAGLGGYYILGAADNSRKSAARLKAQEITKAVISYSLDHQGNFPQTLNQLLQKDQQSGKGPYLTNMDALMDPWGHQYQYNMQGPNNNGLQPDVWCVNPQTNQQFGNWAQGTPQ